MFRTSTVSWAACLSLAAGFAVSLSPSRLAAIDPPVFPEAAGDSRIDAAQRKSRDRKRRARAKEPRPSERKPALSAKPPPPANEKEKARTARAVEPKPAPETEKPGQTKSDQGKSEPGKPGSLPAPLADPKAEIKDAWTDQEIIGALTACVRALGPAAVEIEPAPPVRAGQCGAAAPIMLRRIGAAPGVEIRPPAMVNCEMARRLHDWMETVVQPAARELLGAPVAQLIHLSGYDCRFRNNAPLGKLSEHAFANALDIGGFVAANKRRADVLGHWGPTAADLEKAAEAERLEKAGASAGKEKPSGEAARGKSAEDEASSRSARAKERDNGKRTRGRDRAAVEVEGREAGDEPEGKSKRGRERRRNEGVEAAALKKEEPAKRGREVPPALPLPELTAQANAAAATPERAFLARIHKGACGIFATVLGPEANEYHRNHFHVDLAARKRKPFCE